MSQRFSNIFEELGMTVEDTAEFLQMMGVNATSVRDVDKMQKLKTIASFVKDIPNKARFFTRITKAEKVDMIDFMYEYCSLRLDMERNQKEMEEVATLLEISPDDEVLRERSEVLAAELGDINQTLDVYER